MTVDMEDGTVGGIDESNDASSPRSRVLSADAKKKMVNLEHFQIVKVIGKGKYI
jgi:hypothetical protein|tara:strand:- start:104 stop:265 length:162 start_codon:yes stop_codon:yes gene_type:complete